jgi:sorbitol/mannitol transport system substrate-binding protein
LTDVVVATVNNGHIIEMEKLSENFEAANPGVTLKQRAPFPLGSS